MWSRQLFIIWFLALTILASQSHEIHKRGLLSKLFGRKSKSNQNVEENLPVKERSRFRKLLKNPIVIGMIGAAVGMIIQKALAAKNMNDVCENQYVQMAYKAGNLDPHLQQILNSIGCNSKNRKYDSTPKENTKFPTQSTTPSNVDVDNVNDNDNEEEEALESHLPPEKESKIKQLLNIARGEKGAKRNFLKGLFGLNKNTKTFKQGHKLPSSSYKLDKDDAKSLQDLEKEIEEYNKAIH